jgi:hypothetical protein
MEERAQLERRFDIAHLPLQERVMDRLVDLLLDADELLAALEDTDAANVRWIEPHIRRAFEEFDFVMRRMTD